MGEQMTPEQATKAFLYMREHLPDDAVLITAETETMYLNFLETIGREDALKTVKAFIDEKRQFPSIADFLYRLESLKEPKSVKDHIGEAREFLKRKKG